MAKQYLIVNGDQILLDVKLVFAAIREAKGDWEQVEEDLGSILDNIQGLIDAAEGSNSADDSSDSDSDQD
jgi:hypothetical protein